MRPILKNGTRILRPSEFGRLVDGAETLDNSTKLNTLLLTGLRYVEAQRLRANPDWVDGRFVHLPRQATRKVKRTQKERRVRLSNKGVTIVRYFFKTRPLPTWRAWTGDLNRWAERTQLDPAGLGPKSLRKSWESWLVASYPERVLEIFLSQGHTQMTAVGAYLNLPFSQEDKLGMKEWVDGWT